MDAPQHPIELSPDMVEHLQRIALELARTGVRAGFSNTTRLRPNPYSYMKARTLKALLRRSLLERGAIRAFEYHITDLGVAESVSRGWIVPLD